ncbi:ankyrin repeat-containing domain protein [Annulohypoxylon moriforme]|nr:ankyrin repeat-containing domain protein [Annulohypoxylon moriforme]
MLSDNESDHSVGSLEIIRKAENDLPSIDIVAIRGLELDVWRSWSIGMSNDGKVDALLDNLRDQINMRTIIFNPFASNNVNIFSKEGVKQITECLLRELSLLRNKEEEDRKTPIALVSHGFGGIIAKQALIMAESEATYYGISQNCSQLIFLEVPHRVPGFSSWDDLLLNSSFASPLPQNFPWNMATRIRSLSAFFEGLSSKFISLRMRRSITNIYQLPEDTKDADYQAIHRFSFTSGLVHETNFPEALEHDISELPIDKPAFFAIVASLKAETNPQYRKYLSSLFNISPKFTIPNDQEDLYVSGPDAETWSTCNSWSESGSSCIFMTNGGQGISKNSNARALFRKVKQPSKLAAYYSFSKIDTTRDSFESFLASVSFQVLTQDPERFSRVEDLLVAMKNSNTWTEASLLVLFQSLLDTKDGSGSLYLVIDDLQNCDSPTELVKALAAIVSNDNSPTKLKVVLFYDLTENGGDSILENVLQKCEKVPVITRNMHKLLVASIIDQVTSSKPYLSDLRSQLSDTLEKCKNTTEMLLAVQSLDTSSPDPAPLTHKFLESLIRNPQPSISDAISSKFEHLPEWGRTLLGWILHCKRPLQLNELATAMALTDNRAKFSSSFDPKSLPLEFAADIRFVFGPLVRFEGGGIIFSDITVRSQFLNLVAEDWKREASEKSPSKSRIPDDVDITGILFGYLSWEEFTTPVNDALRGKLDEFIQPPGELFDLITYAVRFLPFHYRACKNNDGLPSFAQDRFILMWPKLNSVLNSTASPPRLCVADPVLLAAQLGLTGMIKPLRKDIVNTRRQTAIGLASWGGHVDTVCELLTGECVERTEKIDTTEALEYASARGYNAIVPLIVAYMKETAHPELPLLINQHLCKAAELGYEKQVIQWIELGADIDAAPDNITPLQHATRNGHASIVKYLLEEKNADVNSKAGSGLNEPILLASMRGHELIVQHLLKAKADLTCVTKDEARRTSLYLAAEYGHLVIVKRLLKVETPGYFMVNQQSSSGNSPLMIACMRGYTEIGHELLGADANVTLCNAEGRTALYHALRPSSEDLAMKILRDAKSPADFKDINDVFLRAAELGFEVVIDRCFKFITEDKRDELLEHSDFDGRKALHNASKNGHFPIARLLLLAGVEVDPKDKKGLTPLVLAAEAGEKEIVRLLIERGANARLQVYKDQSILCRMARQSKDSMRHAAVVNILLQATDIDPNLMDGNRMTALHSAAELGHLEIIKALLRHSKVNPNSTGRWNWNALHFLARCKNKFTRKIAELLIESGTDPMALDFDNWLPVHVASQCGNISLLEVLLGLHPECLEARSDEGRTPLLFGIHRVESVKWLMEHGADGNAKSLGGNTPLITAADYERYKTVHVLLDYGCDASLVNEKGRTALHSAAYNGDVRTGRELLKTQVDILSIRDETNLSALHHAIRNQKTEFAEFLLSQIYSKVDIDIRIGDLCAATTNDGETPLISAIRTDQDGISRQLLLLGANPEHRDMSGSTALLETIRVTDGSRLDMLRTLLDPEAPNRADVNAGGGANPTALHKAAWYGELELCKELVKLGARVDAQGGQFNTALSAAASNGYYKVAMFLLDEQKANPNLPAGNFANTLGVALWSWTYPLITPLLKAEVDIHATDIQGRSAFHIAARRGSWSILEQLLDANEKDLPPADKQGRTLLHFAAMSGDRDMFLRVLADETMLWDDIDIEDVDGWTPLHWACRQNESLDIVKEMEAIGADFSITTRDGWTPENIAITHDATEVASYIQSILSKTNNPSVEAQTAPSQRHWKVGALHSNAGCDGCLISPITGVRWHCADCPDFDFCFKCYWTAKDTHDPNHTFTAIPKEGKTGRAPEYEDELEGLNPDEAKSENDEDKSED